MCIWEPKLLLSEKKRGKDEMICIVLEKRQSIGYTGRTTFQINLNQIKVVTSELAWEGGYHSWHDTVFVFLPPGTQA